MDYKKMVKDGANAIINDAEYYNNVFYYIYSKCKLSYANGSAQQLEKDLDKEIELLKK